MTAENSPPSEGRGPEEHFLAALREGHFLLQRCTRSGRFVFFPRAISPWSGDATLEWVLASGRGTVYAATTVRRRPAQGGDYNVSLVDLEEGVRMMSRVEGVEPSAVRIGMDVDAGIDASRERPIVIFRPRNG